MSVDRQLSRAVAEVATLSVEGRFYRFCSQRRVPTAFDGSPHGGRWGPPDTFPVLYLTDDYDSCVIEAYRHLTDPMVDTEPPRLKLALVTCDVAVTNILDLTTASARMSLGLDPAILHSEPQDPATGAAYQACSRIALIAHQLNRHGILVPAATGRGDTLALFTDLLPRDEQPQRVGPATAWEALPADPRRLRMVREERRP